MVSDIHLEFPGALEALPEIPVRSPILALLGNRLGLSADSNMNSLGDIGYVDDETYQKYLLDQAERFEHVIVLAGNHEYYKQHSFESANEQLVSPPAIDAID